MVLLQHIFEGPSMAKVTADLGSVTRIGVDIAKSVFQVHGVDASGAQVFTKKLRRSRFLEFFRGLAPCAVAMEACSTAHHWGRELCALGHDVRLIPAAHVKPYVRRNKNDAADAAAIAEAAGRPGQRFVAVRGVESQAGLMRHRVRELLMGQRTALLNALRGHLAEIGMVAAKGVERAYELKQALQDGADADGVVIPEVVRAALLPLAAQIEALDAELARIDAEIEAAAMADERARLLMTIPGIGPLIASALLATVSDLSLFAGPRDFAAFLGLVPRQHSSGGRERLGRISKMGDRYLRKLLVVGATSALRTAAGHRDALRTWATQLLRRKDAKTGFKVTAVALANKLARIVFAVLRSGKAYDDRPVAAAA
jgi:transposase